MDTNRNWEVHWGFKEKDYDPREEYPGTQPFRHAHAFATVSMFVGGVECSRVCCLQPQKGSGKKRHVAHQLWLAFWRAIMQQAELRAS